MQSKPKVKVRQGIVLGGEGILPNGNIYNYFKGIPYAVPPLGDLRFQGSYPMERFPSPEIDCTKDGDDCLHKNPITDSVVGSENCLFLNVYTPKRLPGKYLPVMVFIHESAFLFGSANSKFYTPLYLLQENVVVVTFNYRLGPLGFLSLPEANIPGNAGLKDQILALRWVSENIFQFNGDPNNVTLFGISAGASSAHLLMLSENSKKFFHKAILQSGTANMTWAIEENVSEKYLKFAKLLGCTSEDPVHIADFLRNYSNLEDLFKYNQELADPEESRRAVPLKFRPVIEKDSPDAVITEEPLKLMKRNDSINIPVMMGFTSAEGILSLGNYMGKVNSFNQDLAKTNPIRLNLEPEDPRSFDLSKIIKNFYFKGKKPDTKALNNFVDLLGDIHVFIDMYIASELHARKQPNSPLFVYRFDYVGALDFYKNVFQLGHLKGACHADDRNYIFQSVLAENLAESRDRKMSETMCKLWANFAKYGNPTPEQSEPFVDCKWEPVKYVGDDGEFTLNAFVIDEKQKMIENPYNERVEFWKSIYRTYNGAWLAKL